MFIYIVIFLLMMFFVFLIIREISSRKLIKDCEEFIAKIEKIYPEEHPENWNEMDDYEKFKWVQKQNQISRNKE